MKKYISTLLAAALSASTFAALESPITESTTVSSSETVNSQLIVRNPEGKFVQLKILGSGTVLTSNYSGSDYAIDLKASTQLVIEDGGGLNITTSGSGVAIRSGASMLVNTSVGEIEMAKVVLFGSKLTIKSENAFSCGKTGTTLMLVSNGSYMELAASQSFNKMDIRANSTIKFSDGVTLNFKDIDITNSASKIDVVLEDFSNTNSIYFGSASGLSLINGVLTVSKSDKSIDYTFKDKAGEIMKNLVLDAKTNTLTLASIPEPSTYAAVFGALALGLALYRRRK